MMLNNNEVIEYFLDEENNITGFQRWPETKRKEFKKNPPLLDEIIEHGLKDEYRRPKYKLINNKIVKIELKNPTSIQMLKNMSMIDMVKVLIKGIENKNNSEFKNFCEIINIEEDINEK